MQTKTVQRKNNRLIDNLEIEIIKDEDENSLPFPMSYTEPSDPSPIDILRELVNDMENFDPLARTPDPARDEALATLSEMERHMREFQRQTAKLKSLLSRYH
jgi:hypothetical protein